MNKPKEEQIFKFFSADPDDYRGGYLQRFLHKIDYIFNTQLRETVVHNMIEQWVDFLKKFLQPEYYLGDKLTFKNNWDCNGKPLIQLWIICKRRSEKVEKKDKKQKKKDKKSDQQHTEIYLKPR